MAEQSQLFAFMSYSSTTAFVGKLINVMNTFVWTYMDVFVMLISVGLSSRFMQINENLFKHKGMVGMCLALVHNCFLRTIVK